MTEFSYENIHCVKCKSHNVIVNAINYGLITPSSKVICVACGHWETIDSLMTEKQEASVPEESNG